jgi:hypothetical protein
MTTDLARQVTLAELSLAWPPLVLEELDPAHDDPDRWYAPKTPDGIAWPPGVVVKNLIVLVAGYRDLERRAEQDSAWRETWRLQARAARLLPALAEARVAAGVVAVAQMGTDLEALGTWPGPDLCAVARPASLRAAVKRRTDAYLWVLDQIARALRRLCGTRGSWVEGMGARGVAGGGPMRGR